MMAGYKLNTLIVICTVLCSVDAAWQAIHAQNRTTQLNCGFTVPPGSDGPCDLDLQQVFKLLRVDDTTVLIGSTECLYALDRELMSVRSVRLALDTLISADCETFFPPDSAEGKFRCQNYLTYADELSYTEPFRVCGTYNTIAPHCWFCSLTETELSCGSPSYATDYMPKTPTQNFTVINGNNGFYYLGGSQGSIHLDSNTIAKIENVKATVIDAVSTDQGAEYILKSPVNFVKSIDRGNYIYFFFRESAYEYRSIKDVAFARVARVCKNDNGSEIPPLNRFVTFMKTRLMCSVGADSFPFIFNELQDVKLSSDGNYAYGLFATARGGPSSTAICRYDMVEVDSLFDTDFRRGQPSQNPTFLWQKMDRNALDTESARQCLTNFTRNVDLYEHIMENPLLNTNAPNCGLGQTCADFSRTSHDALAVFEGIRGQQLVISEESGDTIKVFVGTNNHTIYEATVTPTDAIITRQLEIQADLASVTDGEKQLKWPFAVTYLQKDGNQIFGTLDNCAFQFSVPVTEELCFHDRTPSSHSYNHPMNIPGVTTLVFKLIEGPDGSNMRATFPANLDGFCEQTNFKSNGARKREFLHVSCKISGITESLSESFTVSSLTLDSIAPLDVSVTVALDETPVSGGVDPDVVNAYDIEMAKYRYKFQEWLGNVTCPDGDQQTCPSANSLG